MMTVIQLDRLEALDREYQEIDRQIRSAEAEAAALNRLSSSDAFPFDRHRAAFENCARLQHNLNDLIDKVERLIATEYSDASQER